MELNLIKKFCDNNINMWNPNTNYLVYLSHFKTVLTYSIRQKKYQLTYKEWLDLLNSDNPGSKIGSETHNICHALNIIESDYKYKDNNDPNDIIITIPRDLLYQYYIDDEKFSNSIWNIIRNRYFDYLNNNNIFELQSMNHIQSVCLNLYVCYLIDSGKKTIEELSKYIDFAKNRGENIEEKLKKVYSYDICKENANILEKLQISSNGRDLSYGTAFLNAILQSLNDSERNNLDVSERENSERITGAYNIIYYGTPGCGKSFKVNKDFNPNDYLVYRTIFHPEYSNSDFVGQIIPKTENNGIKYEFQAGTFTLALCEALKNPSKKICLIIEEINRGNASAIFGDIFQLLDRGKDGSSIYCINNESVKDYLNKNNINIDKITIPSNMWIVATMNTSDQNVFTLDTAFKRRWRMHRIINEFNKSEEYDSKLASMYIPGSSYTWEQFIITVNTAIMTKNPTGLNSEDKKLGVYFATENELSMTPVNNDKEAMDKFIEKVLLYIWDDVAKLDPSLWFDDKINSFDNLVKSYYDNKLRIFKDMFTDQNNESQITDINDEI